MEEEGEGGTKAATVGIIREVISEQCELPPPALPEFEPAVAAQRARARRPASWRDLRRPTRPSVIDEFIVVWVCLVVRTIDHSLEIRFELEDEKN